MKTAKEMKEYRIEYDWAEPHKYAHFQHNFFVGLKANSKTEAIKKFLDDWIGNNQVIVTEIFRTGLRQNGESLKSFDEVFEPRKSHKKNIVSTVKIEEK